VIQRADKNIKITPACQAVMLERVETNKQRFNPLTPSVAI